MNRPSLDAVRGFDRAVYAVALGQLLNVLGAGMVYPFATVHFHLTVGIALAAVGLGLLANNVATAVATAVGGSLADGYGRKPVMVASMAGNAVTLSAYAVVPDIAAAVDPLTPASAFLLVATAAGLTGGLYAPAGQAYTADLTEGGDRDRAFSLLKVANNVGFGAGFVLGGVLYELASVAVFVADGATSAVVAVGLALALPRATSSGSPDATSLRSAVRAWARAARHRRVLFLALLNVGFAVMYAQMRTTVPVVAETRLGLDAAQLGTLFVLNPLTLVVLQIPVVAAVTDWRRTCGLMASAGLWAASMLAVGTVYWAGIGPPAEGTAVADTPLLALGVAFVGAHLVLRTVGEVLHSPLSTSLMSELGTAGERGSHLSVLEIAKRLGFGIGSFVGGVFYDYGLAPWLWPALAATCGLLVVGLLVLERRLNPAENGVASPGDGETL